MAQKTVVLDPAALQRYIDAGNGPVVAELVRRGERVKNGARRRVGKDTLRLHNAIVKRVVSYKGRPAVTVGFSGVPYGIHHHDGTRPHIIRPRRKKVLAFYLPKAGKVIFAREVHHPGTKPNRFLTDSLADA